MRFFTDVTIRITYPEDKQEFVESTLKKQETIDRLSTAAMAMLMKEESELVGISVKNIIILNTDKYPFDDEEGEKEDWSDGDAQ
jgi:hypothetical protein